MSYVSDELFKYIRQRMPDFFIINTVELLPHLPCLTQMDQEKINATAKHEGNEAAVPILLDFVRRRNNWERQLINALRTKEYYDLADDLEYKLESLGPRRNVAVSPPNRAAAHSSLVPAVPPSSAPAAVSLPQNPSRSVIIADNSTSSPGVFSPASYLPTHPSSNQPVLQPSAGTPVVPSSANIPVVQPSTNIPLAQSPANIPVVQSSANIPAVQPSPDISVVQPSANIPVAQPSANIPKVQPWAGTPVAQSSTNIPEVQSSAGTPVAQSLANTPVAQNSTGTPVVQPSVGTPVVPSSAPAANLQPSALFSATSNTSTASSSVSSAASNFATHGASIECKMPIQEIGKSMDSEEDKDAKLPVQEKLVHSQPSDSSRGPKNQTINSDQNNSGEKREAKEIFTPGTDQAKREAKNNQAGENVPSTQRQVAPHRPLYQSNDDDFQDIGKPEILRSVVENVESGTGAAFNSSAGVCSTTSSDLQFSESTVDNSRSNHSDSTLPSNNLNQRDGPKEANPLSLGDSSNRGANASSDFNDKNSMKEQKIQALRGYQNDQRQRDFYDVHCPLNIQSNFDAEKKISGIDEAVDPDQKDISNQDINSEYKPKPFQMSNVEITQSVPVPTRTEPGDNRAESEVDFMENAQLSNSTDTNSDKLLISSDSGCSLDKTGNVDCVSEPSVHGEQDSQNANVLNNNPQLPSFQLLGTQESAQIHNMDTSQKKALNQTTEFGCELQPTGDQNLHLNSNETHEQWFPEIEADKNSNLEGNVSKKGGSLYPCAMSYSKCDTKPEVENTNLHSGDVKEHVGHIYQEPDYENEAGNDYELEATNLRDAYRRNFGKSSSITLSTEHVPLAPKETSQARQPVNPKGDSPSSNYLFLSTSVLILSVVAACIWKYYRK
ncbi:uncharacterized protein LOC144500648 [Mustelus asterias]